MRKEEDSALEDHLFIPLFVHSCNKYLLESCLLGKGTHSWT